MPFAAEVLFEVEADLFFVKFSFSTAVSSFDAGILTGFVSVAIES